MFFKHANKCSHISMAEAEKMLKENPAIRLLDVRTEEEYKQGHIPGSMNLPLNRISAVESLLPEQDAKVFVYCLSGTRSGAACEMMREAGYSDVTNIGGISQWNGKIERG